ncbi:hypothetical protein RJ641_033400 [Dillenia turbinata]|uniref:Uncharacterized protein n=1 Tax=Dillenia turbinata TaxID=194707 RepID=A0AAN8VLH0_9MAGN
MYGRTTEFAFNGFRNFISKILTPNPIRQVCSKATQASSTSSIPNTSLGRRSYHVDRYQVFHFRPRGPKRWFNDNRTMFIIVVVGSGLVILCIFRIWKLFLVLSEDTSFSFKEPRKTAGRVSI